MLFLYCLFALLVEEICFFLAVPLFCNVVDLVDSEFVSIIEHAENIKVLLLTLESLQALQVHGSGQIFSKTIEGCGCYDLAK